MFDLQKASMWKRLSAALFDFILLVIVVVGAALLLSFAFGYDSYADTLEGIYASYEESYGVKFNLTDAEFAALDETAKANYDKAYAALAADAEFNNTYNLMFNYTILIIVFSILAAFLLMEFLIPLLLKNGQTLGKKIFGIGVMRADGLKLPPVLLFARTVLGKYTVETMIPVMIVVMIMFGVMGAFGIVVIAALLAIELGMLIASPARTPIHDKLAGTVTVDIASQMIFDTQEELIEAKNKYNEKIKESKEKTV